MTLDDMIQQCALDVDEEVAKTGGSYSGDALTTATKFLTSLNYAYQKICRERYKLMTSDTVTIDGNQSFDLNSLSKSCINIESIDSAPNYGISWVRRFGTTIIVPSLSSGDTATVNYAYLPDKLSLSSLDGKPSLPENVVDHRILCYFADFEFLKTQVDPVSRNRADMFLAMFNDGFDNIQTSFGEVRQIQSIYDPGWSC